jgi:transposase
MWHIGIDLHRETVVFAAVNDVGEVRPPVRLPCSEVAQIVAAFEQLRPFRAVIEATRAYRWLYQQLSPLGTILLAHPLRLRAMVQRRSKTDRLDAQLLAQLLRINQIPLAYIPAAEFQLLRDITRQRARLTRQETQTKNLLRWLLARHNLKAPYRCPFGPRGLYWFSRQDFGGIDNSIRDELLVRLLHYQQAINAVDDRLRALRPNYPQVEALLVLHGVGLYTAMVIVAELGDVRRFRLAKQAGAYTGLTARVDQSGSHCYSGHITRQGSPFLRHVLVEAAMKIVHQDIGLANFATRIRKRSSAKIARVATARKLAEICWKRLMRWHQEQEKKSAA